MKWFPLLLTKKTEKTPSMSGFLLSLQQKSMTEKEAVLQAISSRMPEQIYSDELDVEFTTWGSREMVEMNNLYDVEENLPGYFGLGSDGEGELLAIELKTGIFYAIPFMDLTKSKKRVVARSFKELMEMEF